MKNEELIIEIIQQQLNNLKQILRDKDPEPEFSLKKRTQSQTQKSYWARFTPEERTAEVMRRRKVAARKKAAK